MTRIALVAAVLLFTAGAEAPPPPPASGIEECWMFDENNVPVGQRYGFFMRCCQVLGYGKSKCFRLWVQRKPQRAATDGSTSRAEPEGDTCVPSNLGLVL